MKGSWREILYEKRYPQWILLLITTIYAVIFMIVVYTFD